MSALKIPLLAVENSSQVKAYGYDPATSTLAVEFKSGGVYHYHEVPAELFTEMQESKSVGSFLHGKVKGGFKFTLIPQEEEKGK